jgi:hypothetical protein
VLFRSALAIGNDLAYLDGTVRDASAQPLSEAQVTVFDEHAEKYDSWFLANPRVLESEVLMIRRALGEPGKTLSVGGIRMENNATLTYDDKSQKITKCTKDLDKAKYSSVAKYVKYMTSKEVQGEMIEKFARLPGLRAALSNPAIANDPILKGSSDQLAQGVPMPTVLEMRCNWDAMKPELIAVLAGTKTPKEAAEAMQKAATACVDSL